MTKQSIIELLKSNKRGKYNVLLFEFKEVILEMNAMEVKLYIEAKFEFTEEEKLLLKKGSLKAAKVTFVKDKKKHNLKEKSAFIIPTKLKIEKQIDIGVEEFKPKIDLEHLGFK